MGRIHYRHTAAEKVAVTRRRSIYLSQDVGVGEVLSEANLRVVRPGHGLEPKHLPLALGRRLRRAVTKGTPLSWDLLLEG